MAMVNAITLPSLSPTLSPCSGHGDKCGICNNEVKETDKAMECDKCKYWIHIKCNNITRKKNKNLQNNLDETLYVKIATIS